jgi:ABC-type lipopolysaccharide export system ATPase subunit
MIHKLEADGILFEIGKRTILSDIFFKCEVGKITGILGRNGTGKSCLMNIVYGNQIAQSKSVRFDSIYIDRPYKRPDLLAYLPQFNFIPKSLKLKRIFSDFNLDYPAFEQYFPEFRSASNSSLKDLSGGHRRLVEVYIIIRSKARFAMLDEPFSHLMPLHIEKIKEILLIEIKTKGFLITDHVFRDVMGICDFLYVLEDGKLHLTKDAMDVEKLGYARL